LNLKKAIVELKKGYCLNFVYRHTTKDITKNFEIVEGIALIINAIDLEFNNAELISATENLSLYTLPNGKIQVKTTASTLKAPVSLAHDKPKDKLIALENNVYLRELGVTNADFELRREMSDKQVPTNQQIH